MFLHLPLQFTYSCAAKHDVEVAFNLGIRIQHGVYAQMLGPNYETPAEVRMLQVNGADAVGMSTVRRDVGERRRTCN